MFCSLGGLQTLKILCLSILTAASLTVPNVVAAQEEGSVVDLSENSPALHFPIGRSGKQVHVVPAFEDYAYMLEDVCDAMGLDFDNCKIYPMNAEIGGNAIATILDGNKVIIYDRTLSPLVGYTGAMAIIAHELGHHFCNHMDASSSPTQELEADRFAGAALRNAKFSLEDALSMAIVFDERPSRVHPEKSKRIEAIKSGWEDPEQAKNCGLKK